MSSGVYLHLSGRNRGDRQNSRKKIIFSQDTTASVYLYVTPKDDQKINFKLRQILRVHRCRVQIKDALKAAVAEVGRSGCHLIVWPQFGDVRKPETISSKTWTKSKQDSEEIAVLSKLDRDKPTITTEEIVAKLKHFRTEWRNNPKYGGALHHAQEVTSDVVVYEKVVNDVFDELYYSDGTSNEPQLPQEEQCGSQASQEELETQQTPYESLEVRQAFHKKEKNNLKIPHADQDRSQTSKQELYTPQLFHERLNDQQMQQEGINCNGKQIRHEELQQRPQEELNGQETFPVGLNSQQTLHEELNDNDQPILHEKMPHTLQEGLNGQQKFHEELSSIDIQHEEHDERNIFNEEISEEQIELGDRYEQQIKDIFKKKIQTSLESKHRFPVDISHFNDSDAGEIMKFVSICDKCLSRQSKAVFTPEGLWPECELCNGPQDKMKMAFRIRIVSATHKIFFVIPIDLIKQGTYNCYTKQIIELFNSDEKRNEFYEKIEQLRQILQNAFLNAAVTDFRGVVALRTERTKTTELYLTRVKILDFTPANENLLEENEYQLENNEEGFEQTEEDLEQIEDDTDRSEQTLELNGGPLEQHEHYFVQKE